MEKMVKTREEEIEWLNSGRVQTDTVHRRFQKKPNADRNGDTHVLQDDYFCEECRLVITAADNRKTLKEHFYNVGHKHYADCVYCSRPAYFYRWKGKQEVFHSC